MQLGKTNSLLNAVVNAMERIAPLSLAEKGWDNVGILLEAPPCALNPEARKVLLTIDLTKSVLSPYISSPKCPISMVISYHPFLFKPFKQITMADDKQSIALTCCAKGVSVYSPHTALDNSLEGINQMLARDIGGKDSQVHWIKSYKNEDDKVVGGSGTISVLESAIDLKELVQRVKDLFKISHVRVATHNSDNKQFIKKIAFCAGSGASVLQGADADVYITGEMSHHEVLQALSENKSVILCEHTNTERFYLSKYLKPKLEQILKESENTKDIEIIVSDIDKDPLNVW